MFYSPEVYLDALLTLPTAERPRVSPDRRWVAWAWYGTGEGADVYAVPTDGSGPPIRLTDTGEDTFLVSWTLDSQAVLVAEDRGGDERARLYRVDIAKPLDMIPLTSPNPRYYLRGGALHPNGRWLVYGANFDAQSETEIEPTWIYRQDLETGVLIPLAKPAQSAMTIPELSPDGKHILYPRSDRHPAGRQIWLVDIEGRADREILNVGDDRKVFASWFPDGKHILVLAETAFYRKLGVWDLADGSLRWLLDDATRNIEGAFVPWGSDRIVVLEIRQARLRSSLLEWQTGEEEHLAVPNGDLIPMAPLEDGMWVGQTYSSQQPSDVIRFPLADVRPERMLSLTRVWERTWLRPHDFARAEDFRWRSVDSLEIQGWLYRPAGEARGTLVVVHGGPSYHSADLLDAEIQFLVRAGFNVLDPNYRGSTGFGLSFREAIKEDGWGGREQEDLRTGIEALITTGIARPGAIGITGTSYGGFSSWWAITHEPPERVAAAAPICGMTDLVVDYETTRPDLRLYSAEMMGGSPAEVPEKYRERSPIHRVGRIRGRLLIVQGLRDPNVTPENVHAVQTALEAAGVPYELLTFEDEGHGITLSRNQRTLYLRLADFFARAFAETRPSSRVMEQPVVMPRAACTSGTQVGGYLARGSRPTPPTGERGT